MLALAVYSISISAIAYTLKLNSGETTYSHVDIFHLDNPFP